MSGEVTVTLEQLREAFHVDEQTGIVTWKVRPLSHFKSEQSMRAWNSKFAGKQAGHLTVEGYMHCGLFGKRAKLHSICWSLVTGIHPAPELDHIDGNRSNNAITNLRECTRPQNCWNMKSGPNKTGYRGVFKHKSRFGAQINMYNKRIYLGLFKTAEEAYAAYCAAAKKYRGEFAKY